jgi:steroid delta-isomerase-like uncharacterized protein
VETHVAAENAHDVAATVATFHRPHYLVPALAADAPGAEAVSGLLAALFGAFPDLSITTRKVYHAADAVITEITMRGTHQGPWAGVEATGRPIDVPASCIFHFDDDRLVSETVYFDHGTLLAQLGMR